MLTMYVILYFETANSNCSLLLTIKKCALDQNFAFSATIFWFQSSFCTFSKKKNLIYAAWSRNTI